MAEREIIDRGMEAVAVGDNRVWGVINHIGNHELKALTPLLMSPERPYDTPAFTAALNGFGVKPGLINSSRLQDFCEDALSLADVVARDDQTGSFMLTKFGIERVIPFSGHVLDLSLNTEPSLIHLLGSSVSPSELRAPTVRFRIYLAMLTSSLPISDADLIKSTGLKKSTVSTTVKALARKGIISRDAISADSSFTLYSLSKDDLGTDGIEDNGSYLVHRIYSLFVSSYHDLKLTREEIWKGLMGKYPDMRYLKRDALLINIGHALSNLVNEHCLIRGNFHATHQSDSTLTSEQRATILELVKIVGRFWRENEAFFETGSKKAQEITSSPEALHRIIRKAKEHGQGSIKVSARVGQEQVLTIIKNYQGSAGIAARDIQEVLEEDFQRGLDIATVRGILRSLEEKGKISSPKRGQANKWFTPDKMPRHHRNQRKTSKS